METVSGSIVGYWIIHILYAALIILVGRVVVKWVIKMTRKLMVRANMDPILINFLSMIANAVLLLIVLIAALDQLGVNTTSMIAILGAAGLAIGLALKDSLQNFAAGVMMILFRPFRIGDFIEAGGTSGIVEEITIFNTLMKTGDNRAVIVPNGKIYAGTITNYSTKDTRRIDMVFSIGYEDDLRKAKALIQDIVTGHEKVMADPAPVIRVSELAESSVNFDVRPWVAAGDYWPVRSELIETIKLAFDANGISIPFPQVDMHMYTMAKAETAEQSSSH